MYQLKHNFQQWNDNINADWDIIRHNRNSLKEFHTTKVQTFLNLSLFFEPMVFFPNQNELQSLNFYLGVNVPVVSPFFILQRVMSAESDSFLVPFLLSVKTGCLFKPSPQTGRETARGAGSVPLGTLKGKCTLNEEMGGGGGAHVELFFFPGGRVADSCTNPSPTAALLPLVRQSPGDRHNCPENDLKTFRCHIDHPGMWSGFSSTTVPLNGSISKMLRKQAGWRVATGSCMCS